jgi:hypothetical protein
MDKKELTLAQRRQSNMDVRHFYFLFEFTNIVLLFKFTNILVCSSGQWTEDIDNIDSANFSTNPFDSITLATGKFQNIFDIFYSIFAGLFE